MESRDHDLKMRVIFPDQELHCGDYEYRIVEILGFLVT